MKCCKKILLQLSSNVNSFKVTISDGIRFINCKVLKNCNICFYTSCKSITLIARPVNNNYTTTNFVKIDVTNCNKYKQYFNFSKNVFNNLKVYEFNLFDLNYGLKINGLLRFNLI